MKLKIIFLLISKFKSKITQEQIDNIIAEFEKFDTDNNGKLTKKEYYIMLKKDGQNLKANHLKSFVRIKYELDLI